LRPVFKDIWQKRRLLPPHHEIEQPEQLARAEQQALDHFHNGQALLNIVKPANFQPFKQQLVDPQHQRPNDLRHNVNNPDYKYVHLEHRIVRFDPAHKNRTKAQPDYTKKTSMTLISQHLNTPVFGMHDPQRELVGLQFDSQQACYKAYLKQDQGTVNHGWYGQWDPVQNYRQKMNTVNLTRFSAFVEQVEQNGPRLVNETLAKVNLAGLQSVVIAKDTDEARRIARERAHELSQAAGRSIAIVFYDPIQQQISPYTALQQQADECAMSPQYQ